MFQFSKINLAAPERAARSLLGSKPSVSAGPPRGNKLVARLVPSRQCLFHSHGAVSPTNVCVLFPHRQPHLSGGHRSFPVVRKDLTMKTIVVIGSTTNPIP